MSVGGHLTSASLVVVSFLSVEFREVPGRNVPARERATCSRDPKGVSRCGAGPRSAVGVKKPFPRRSVARVDTDRKMALLNPDGDMTLPSLDGETALMNLEVAMALMNLEGGMALMNLEGGMAVTSSDGEMALMSPDRARRISELLVRDSHSDIAGGSRRALATEIVASARSPPVGSVAGAGTSLWRPSRHVTAACGSGTWTSSVNTLD